jgi:hypothetical protein
MKKPFLSIALFTFWNLARPSSRADRRSRHMFEKAIDIILSLSVLAAATAISLVGIIHAYKFVIYNFKGGRTPDK